MKRLIWMAIVLFAASTAFAQSLAEVAKKEKERRKQLSSSESRTITDTELRRAGGPRLLTSAPSTQGGATEEGTEEDSSAEEDEDEAASPRQNEQYWRGRLAPIDSRIKTLEERLASPQFTMNPVGAQDRERVERDLAEARAQRQAVLDEARRAGAPPGWLR